MNKLSLSVARMVGLVGGSLLALACGDSSSTDSDGQGGGSGGDAPGGGAVCGLTPAVNSEFCADAAATPDCDNVTSQKNHVCGVPLKDAPAELERSSNVVEFAGSGAPQVSCFEDGNHPDPPQASETVTVTGFARIFSHGCDSHYLKITFYTVQEDGQLGDVVGTSVVTPETCVDIGEESEVDDCDGRWECSYTYAGVPTETQLAVRTENGSADLLWSPLVQYNVYIPNSEVVDGGWEHDVRALAEDDYSLIPMVAIGSPIKAGNGAVAGEVHDCGDVRLTNAVADIDAPHVITTYFTSNEDSPLPDQAADGTSVLGLYAALDVEPGPVTVAAGGFVNGEFVTLGQHKVYVYPDTVTSVTFKGLRPYQVE
jgi:hypothetical protein